MKVERARQFLFEPARLKNDPAVMSMTLEERGAYLVLFCEGWDMPEPGVFPDDDNLLAMYARVDIETWGELRQGISKAFDKALRPGFWIQKGTLETHRKQEEWFARQASLGSKGGLKRAFKARFKRSSSGVGGKVLFGVEGVEGNAKQKDSNSVPLTERSAEPPESQPRSLANLNHIDTNSAEFTRRLSEILARGLLNQEEARATLVSQIHLESLLGKS